MLSTISLVQTLVVTLRIMILMLLAVTSDFLDFVSSSFSVESSNESFKSADLLNN